MTFEFINIVQKHLELKKLNHKSVLATVVQVEGSSYRRPGVQMLISSDGEMCGAVSGGCVEKEVQRQAQSVLENGVSKVMTYDGRFRLGCEGMLYILLEVFDPSDDWISAFDTSQEERTSIALRSYYQAQDAPLESMHSQVSFDGKNYLPVDQSKTDVDISGLSTFENQLAARFRIVIVGAEHDSIQLSAMAAQMGWEVIVVASATNPKTLEDFPGAKKLLNVETEAFDLSIVDENSAVILMSHSFSRDLHFLLRMTQLKPKYFGILGPVKRREQLLDELMEKEVAMDVDFIEQLQAPAGLNIGAETPQEIAVSILSEILVVCRNANAERLKNIKGHIHDRKVTVK